ncbi:MAG: glycosyl transferase, partial [Rhodospirillaceae bacterium]
MRTVVVAALIAAALHASAWFFTHRVTAPPENETTFQSLSLAPYAKDQDPANGDVPTAEQIDHDLARIAPYTRAVRTYTTTGGPELVPMLAHRHGLAVSIGAWVDTNGEHSRREIEAAIELARTHRNVRAVLVGNEMLYRGDKTEDEIVAMIRHVRKRVKVPVSTGEIWSEWLKNPRLVNAVDFIAVHILPYWEGVPAEQAVSYALTQLDELRRTYPGKRIVVAEFGWPSNGANKFKAKADPVLQGQVIRQFLAEAHRRGIEYNVVEAFDQPWKNSENHGVGPYWGIFNADRQIKFPLTGVVENRTNRLLAVASLVVGFALTIAGLRRRRATFGHAFAYATAANALGVGLVMAGAYPFLNYMNWGIWIMWGLGSFLLLPLVLISLAKVHELAEVLLGVRPRRLLTPFGGRPPMARLPKVSVHIPAYREPPAMLKAALDAVAALDYPSFEVLVILNNTPEEEYWKPIEMHCKRLGERFKFVFLPRVAGFKAGAMNAALPFMAADAEIIAVIDADYVVHRDWLKDLVPHFADPQV